MTDQELIVAILSRLNKNPAAVADLLGQDIAGRLPDLMKVAGRICAPSPYELFFGRGMGLQEIAQEIGGEASQYSYLHETPAPGQAELSALRAQLITAQVSEHHAVDRADRAGGCADRLAYAAFGIDDIGEHTSANDPWDNAAERLETLSAQGVLNTGGLAALAQTWERRAEAQPGLPWNQAAHELRGILNAAPQEQPLTGWTGLQVDGGTLLGIPPQGGAAREIGDIDSSGQL